MPGKSGEEVGLGKYLQRSWTFGSAEGEGNQRR